MNEVDWSDLHDSILRSISVDWESRVLQIFIGTNQISDWKGKDIVITCGQSTILHCEHLEPWGGSIYINEAKCENNNNGQISIQIEMQSGDIITIECQSIAVIKNEKEL